MILPARSYTPPAFTGGKKTRERTGLVKLIFLFWFIRLFKPEWIVSYYVPALRILRPVPTVLLLLFLAYLIVSGNRPRLDKTMLVFALVCSASTLGSANVGISWGQLRYIFETLFLFSFAMTFVNSERSIKRLFGLYLAAFLIFGIWGILDGGKVRAFMPLEDEDSFGPYMTIGVAFAYFIMSTANKGSWMKRFCFVTIIVCLGGAAASLARGTFLSLLVLIGYIFVRSENKARLLVKICAATVLAIVLTMTMFPSFFEEYTSEIGTIVGEVALFQTETSPLPSPSHALRHVEGTGKDRFYLWTQALQMFYDNPLLGVGPGCYGFKIQSYVTREEAERWGVRYQMYGRAIHNIYFEVLSELGALGIIVFIALLVVFRRRNLAIRRVAEQVKGLHSSMRSYSLALEGGMIALLANGFFFNLLFFSWFWDMLILNTLLYQRMRVLEAEAKR